MKYCLYICYFLMGLTQESLMGQTYSDSLWHIWQNSANADSVRLKALHEKAKYLMDIVPDSSMELGIMLMEHAQNHPDKTWLARGHDLIGSIHYYKGDFKEALEQFQKALHIRESIKDLRGMSASFSNITLVYSNLGNHTKALDYQEESLRLDLQLKDTAGISNSFNSLANIYQDQGDYDKALEYFNKSLKYRDSDGDSAGRALIYNNLGVLYSAINQYDLALDYFEKALEIRVQLDDQQDIAIIKGNMGFTYIQTGEFDLSMKMFQETIELQERLGDHYGKEYTYYMIGALYQKRKQFKKALPLCERFYDFAKDTDNLSMQQKACFCLYEAHKGMGNMQDALAFHEKYKDLYDTIRQENVSLKLNLLEWEWALQQDSLANQEELLRMEVLHQTELRKKTKSGNLLLVLSLIFTIGALALLSRMFYFQKSSEQFQTRAEGLEKQKLINEIALLKTQVNPHFLFNSLSILSSLVRKNPTLSERFIDQLSKSYRYILEQNEENLVSLRTELEFIKAYTFLLSIRFEDKLAFNFQLEEKDFDKYYIAPMTLQLLIENAVKHNKMSKRSPLIIELSLDKDWLYVKNKLQPRSIPSSSTGIGLANIKNRYTLLTEKEVTTEKIDDHFVVKVPLLIHEEVPIS